MMSQFPKQSIMAAVAFALVATFLLLGPQPVNSQTTVAPGASVAQPVAVPASMQTAPFDIPRQLLVPPGFTVSVLARLPGARFLAVTPNGDVLASQPSTGTISLIRPNPAGDPTILPFATGLRNPHDMVFHTIAGTTYLYVSESHQINRFIYNAGDLTAQNRQIIIQGLPDSSNAELQGAYGHQLKNIAIGPDDKLYIAIASATNASPSDAISNPVRCAVYQYSADGTNGRLFVQGLRNAEGLAILPGSNTLWVTVNQRDNIAYPNHQDIDGDGSDDYGKVIPAYVDHHPPEAFTSVVDGANYGWPYANPNPDTPSVLNRMPFDPDVENNLNFTAFPASTFTPIDRGIDAHSAPLGFSFLQSSVVPAAYRNGAMVALHGSWNRTRKGGYRVICFPWNTTVPGEPVDFVSGWLNEATNQAWDRPVDVVPDLSGSVLVSCDQSGTIYKIAPQAQ